MTVKYAFDGGNLLRKPSAIDMECRSTWICYLFACPLVISRREKFFIGILFPPSELLFIYGINHSPFHLLLVAFPPQFSLRKIHQVNGCAVDSLVHSSSVALIVGLLKHSSCFCSHTHILPVHLYDFIETIVTKLRVAKMKWNLADVVRKRKLTS